VLSVGVYRAASSCVQKEKYHLGGTLTLRLIENERKAEMTLDASRAQFLVLDETARSRFFLRKLGAPRCLQMMQLLGSGGRGLI